MAIRIGVIALEDPQSKKLIELLEGLGVEIGFRLLPHEILESHIRTESIDVWLLNVDDDNWDDRFDDLLERATVPVFFNEPSDIQKQQHLQFWGENLIDKLRSMAEESKGKRTAATKREESKPQENVSPKANEESNLHVWVLGASLGGPAAVKLFLQKIPRSLEVCFVLAQHIDSNFLPSLAKTLQSDNGFTPVMVEGSHQLKHGQLILTPVDSRVVITPTGIIGSSDAKWSSSYAPCISDVIQEVSETFKYSGTIIFSGMGDDAIEGCRASRAKKRPVWTQAPETCANPTMPEAVVEAGLVDYTGTPQQLAEALILYVKQGKHAQLNK